MAETIDNTTGMPVVTYSKPDLPRAGAATLEAKAVEVDSQETYDFANTMLGGLKDRHGAIEARRVAMVKPLDESRKAIQGFFKPVLDDLDSAMSVLKSSMLGFQREQRRLQAEEQARADRAAREAREALAAEARAAEEAGDAERANVLQATAAVISAPIATSTYTQAKGLSTRKTWKARVTDRAKLIAAILANPAFIDLIVIDESALNKHAKAFEGKVPLAGVECYEEETLARRAA